MMHLPCRVTAMPLRQRRLWRKLTLKVCSKSSSSNISLLHNLLCPDTCMASCQRDKKTPGSAANNIRELKLELHSVGS